MLERQEFYRKRTGNLTVRDDCWSVLLDRATGQVSVEHRWVYRDLDNERPLSEDRRDYSLEEFGLTDIGQELQSRLKPALESLVKN